MYRELTKKVSKFDSLELIAFASEKSKSALLRDMGELCPADAAEKIRRLCVRRESGEPLAYIFGEWDFYGLRLIVTPDVLIPRIDSEALIDAALTAVTASNPRILDLCCGSGCLGLALLSKLPNAALTAVDISAAALEVTRINAERLGFSERVTLINADILQAPDHSIFNSDFSLIISNPPYVTALEMAALDKSVADYEPHLALYGGADGLNFYRAIAAYWGGLPAADGVMVLECGHAQKMAVEEIFSEYKNKVTVIGTGG
jgi:release factor glutamine methyltransferase